MRPRGYAGRGDRWTEWGLLFFISKALSITNSVSLRDGSWTGVGKLLVEEHDFAPGPRSPRDNDGYYKLCQMLGRPWSTENRLVFLGVLLVS